MSDGVGDGVGDGVSEADSLTQSVAHSITRSLPSPFRFRLTSRVARASLLGLGSRAGRGLEFWFVGRGFTFGFGSRAGPGPLLSLSSKKGRASLGLITKKVVCGVLVVWWCGTGVVRAWWCRIGVVLRCWCGTVL